TNLQLWRGAIMFGQWLRRMVRYKSGKARKQRGRARACLHVERLEERAVPAATATWTGTDAPNGNPTWSDGNNWIITNPDVAGQTVPQNGDNLVFPVIASQFKTVPGGNAFGPSPPNPNSVNDLGALTVASITIQDSGYLIGDISGSSAA